MNRIISIILLLAFFSFSGINLNAQTPTIDSIENLLQKHTSEDTLRVNLLNKLALEYFKENKYDEAIQNSKIAEELSVRINFAKGNAMSSRLIGKCFYYKANYTKALEYLQKSLKLKKEIDDKHGISICLADIANINFFQGDYTQAQEYYQESMKIDELIDNKEGVSRSLNCIGNIHMNQGNFNLAIEYIQKALTIDENLNNENGIANCLTSLGNIYLYQGNYSKALEYYRNALKIFETLGYKHNISSLLNNIGNIYYEQNSYSKALEFYQNSLKIKEELGLKKGISINLNNIGNIYQIQGDYAKALEYMQKSLVIKKEIGDKQGISVGLINIGDIFKNQENYAKALEYFQKSLEISKEIGDQLKICTSYTQIGEVYHRSGNNYMALNYTNMALKIATELYLINNQKDIQKLYSEIYAASKNYKKAYENYVLYKELNDSIFNEENVEKITRLELQYAFEKEKELASVEQLKNEALAAKELKYQKTLRNVFIEGLLVAILIILLYARLFQMNRKTNKLLNLKNQEIIKQKDQIVEQNAEIQAQTEVVFKHKDHLEKKIKERTADLIIAKEKAEESNKLKTAFLNNISHEFRTPINGIIGFSNLLSNPNLAPEKLNQYITNINKSCSHLTNIVNDTVELSEAHSNQAKIYYSSTNIYDLIVEIVNEFKETANNKNIDIKIVLNLKNDELIVLVDVHKFKRVFWHLLNNAVKFTYSGQIIISGLNVNGNQFQFAIEDTGIGISLDLHEKIFDPFMQAELNNNRRFGGNGIGLSLSKAYVELLGGKIWIESQVDKGTKVFFRIPLEKGKVKGEVIIKPEIKTETISNKTILVAEDDELSFILVHEILQAYDLNILHAWNGKEALHLLKKEDKIDLMLIDLKMPVMDGYEAIKRIRTNHPNISVIAQTSYASETNIEEITLAGFDDYITKPIDEKTLILKLKQWM